MGGIALAVCWAGLAADLEAFKVGAFTFSRPARWDRIEVTSSLRKAEFRVRSPRAGPAAEVIFFQFPPGQGGSAQANADRWFAMFKEPREKLGARVERRTVGKWSLTYVEARGTYVGGQPPAKTPSPNYALLGAIIESPDGNVFARMVGPADLAESAGAEFRSMIEGGLR
jgi:hypothetical protein